MGRVDRGPPRRPRPPAACALLNPGFPLGSVTPFRGVSALSRSTIIQVLGGAASRNGAGSPPRPRGRRTAAGSRRAALVAAVTPLREAGSPVELSLTGGKDSRLVAAALVKAGVPVRGRTHGFADHPDVVVAAEIARRAGHRARRADPGRARAAGRRARQDPRHGAGRRRDAVRVRERRPPRPRRLPCAHRGRPRRRAAARRLRRDGGPPRRRRAARRPGARPRAARSAELLRRLTTKHLGLHPPRRRRRLRRLARPVDRRARPPPAARARRLLPGQPGGPVVGGRPAGVPAQGAPGPAAVRRPGGARRPRRPAGRPGQRRAVRRRPRRTVPAPWRTIPLAGKPPASRARPPSTGAASTATRSRRSCATTSSTWAPPAACSTW